jgi:transcriptional regulator
LYLPAYFEESKVDTLHAMMRSRPLATLLTLGESAIVANHIPVETLSEPAPFGVIRGHIARANPLWRDYRADYEALLIFQGPQAYISPSFYWSKLQTGEVVPTWDYAVTRAAAYGSCRTQPGCAPWCRAAPMAANYRAGRRGRLRARAPPYIEKMLSMIVGFELAIVKLTGKFKLRQNHPSANRNGVVQGLQAGDADGREIAQMLAAFNDRHSD